MVHFWRFLVSWLSVAKWSFQGLEKWNGQVNTFRGFKHALQCTIPRKTERPVLLSVCNMSDCSRLRTGCPPLEFRQGTEVGGCRKECGRRASGWSELLGTSPRSCLRPEHQHARFLLPRTALQIPKTTMISSLRLPRQKHPTPFLSVVVTFSKCHSHLLARSSLQTPFPSAALEMSTSHQRKPVQLA